VRCHRCCLGRFRIDHDGTREWAGERFRAAAAWPLPCGSRRLCRLSHGRERRDACRRTADCRLRLFQSSHGFLSSKWIEIDLRRLLNGSHRALREYFDTFRNNHPRTSRARPGMALYLEPCAVVERPAGDGPQPGENLGGMRDRGPAARAELDAQPTFAFVRAMLECFRGAGAEFDLLLREIRDHGKRASGAALAKRAMTNGRAHGLSAGAVSDRSAKTSAFMNFRHSHLSPSPWPSTPLGGTELSPARGEGILSPKC